MNFEIYVYKIISPINQEVTHWFASYQNGKLSWTTKNDDYISQLGEISIGNVILNGSLALSKSVSPEEIEFLRAKAQDITLGAEQLSEEYKNTTKFTNCSSAEIASEINLFNSAAKHLQAFISEFEKTNNIVNKLQ